LAWLLPDAASPRNETWEKLSSIRHGRKATETYRAASAQR
jgi:hypothetical protein